MPSFLLPPVCLSADSAAGAGKGKKKCLEEKTTPCVHSGVFLTSIPSELECLWTTYSRQTQSIDPWCHLTQIRTPNASIYAANISQAFYSILCFLYYFVWKINITRRLGQFFTLVDWEWMTRSDEWNQTTTTIICVLCFTPSPPAPRWSAWGHMWRRWGLTW